MKRFAIFIFTILLVSKSIAQEIESSSFDKFDSLYKAKTKDRSLESGTVNDIHKNIFFYATRYKDAKKGGKSDVFTGYFIILPENAISIDEKSYIKVLFKDGSQKEYKNEGGYITYGQSEAATIYVTLKKDDPLTKKSVESIRFGYNGGLVDFDVSADNFDYIIRSIKLLSDFTFK